MTNNDKITKLLSDFPTPDTFFSITKAETADFTEAVNLAKDAGLLERTGNSYRWNKKALDIIERGWSYDVYLKKINKTKEWYEVVAAYIMEHIVPLIIGTVLGGLATYFTTNNC
jgi:hypothetical protein